MCLKCWKGQGNYAQNQEFKLLGIKSFGLLCFENNLLVLLYLQINKMPRLPKSEECQKYRCTRHAFIMKPIKGKKGLYFPKATNGKFCPQFNKESRKFEGSLPFLYQDRKIYTPMFILKDEKKFYEQNDEKMKASHIKKIQEFAQKSQMLVPRHVRKRQYCSVCRTEIQQYLDHIESEDHKIKLKANKYNEYILELQTMLNSKKLQKAIPHLEQFSSDFQKHMSEQNKTG